MRITVYLHNEKPYVLEHVRSIVEQNEGDTIIILDEEDGRLEFQDEDIKKFESEHGV